MRFNSFRVILQGKSTSDPPPRARGQCPTGFRKWSVQTVTRNPRSSSNGPAFPHPSGFSQCNVSGCRRNGFRPEPRSEPRGPGSLPLACPPSLLPPSLTAPPPQCPARSCSSSRRRSSGASLPTARHPPSPSPSPASPLGSSRLLLPGPLFLRRVSQVHFVHLATRTSEISLCRNLSQNR